MRSDEIIEAIYDSEIPCRLEWFFDTGFTWSIQDGKIYPRVAKDDDISGQIEVITETVESTLNKLNPLLEKDWLDRGGNYSFNEAIKEMSESIVKHFPNSTFSKWYKDNA